MNKKGFGQLMGPFRLMVHELEEVVCVKKVKNLF